MDFGARVKAIREHRKLKGESFGEPIGLTKQGLSMIENDKRGVSAELIMAICQTYQIDSRFFFNQIENIRDADLRINKSVTLEMLSDKLGHIEKNIRQPADIDSVAYQVANRAPLRECGHVA